MHQVPATTYNMYANNVHAINGKLWVPYRMKMVVKTSNYCNAIYFIEIEIKLSLNSHLNLLKSKVIAKCTR